MHKHPSIFVLTIFKKLEKSMHYDIYETGTTRTVGVFLTLDEAREAIINNSGELCETMYPYGLIEELSLGLYPTPQMQELYPAI